MRIDQERPLLILDNFHKNASVLGCLASASSCCDIMEKPDPGPPGPRGLDPNGQNHEEYPFISLFPGERLGTFIIWMTILTFSSYSTHKSLFPGSMKCMPCIVRNHPQKTKRVPTKPNQLMSLASCRFWPFVLSDFCS